MANSPQMDPQVEVSVSASAGQANVASAAVMAAVDDLVGETDAAPAAASTPAAVETPPPAVADSGAELRELQAYAKAQERWARDRETLAQEARSASDRAKREILEAVQSDDPDGALAAMGLTEQQRRTIVERMVLRHVPADKANGELRERIEKDQLKQQIQALNKRLDKQDEDRVRERQETTQRQQAQQAIQTLHDAFQSAGDDAKFARARYGKRREAAVADALDVGKELIAKGEISTKMPNAEISRRIVKALDERYRADFELGGSSGQATAAQNPPQGVTTQNAPEVRGARTITRGSVAVTRPPDPAPASASEDDELAEMAAEMAKLRREGKFSS